MPPEIPGLIYDRPHGNLCVATTNHYDDEMSRSLQEAGITVNAVEPLTLEEIFLANVLLSRGAA